MPGGLRRSVTMYLYVIARRPAPASNTSQNHSRTKIFSFTTFSGSTQSASSVCTEPAGPNVWIVHLVTFGNSRAIGSILSPSPAANALTSGP